MKSIQFLKTMPITNENFGNPVVFKKFQYKPAETFTDASATYTHTTLSTLLTLHTNRHIKIELSYFNAQKQAYTCASLTEEMANDVFELLFNGNIVTIEKHTYRLPRKQIRPRMRFQTVQVDRATWLEEKPLRDKRIADFHNYRANRINFDALTVLQERLVKDGMSNKPKYNVFCSNPTVWYNAAAEYQFDLTIQNYEPLTPAELADYEANARYYGAPDPTICWHYEARAISLATKKPTNDLTEKVVFTNEIKRDLADFNSVFVTAGTTETLRNTVVFAQKKYTATHPALLRESYNYYRFVKDAFGDEALLPDYARCPHCNQIYRISKLCECFEERRAQAQEILLHIKQLASLQLIQPENIESYLSTKHNTTLTKLYEDLNPIEFHPQPDMSIFGRSGQCDTFEDYTDDSIAELGDVLELEEVDWTELV